MAEVRGKVLALEAGKTLMLDKGDFLRAAEEKGIVVVAVTNAAFS